MIAHPDDAYKYSKLKYELARKLHWGNLDSYYNGKDQFVKMMEKRALEWSRSQRPEEFQQLEECLL
jgi:GrpB-like predicted nucleotidyltransferase (UPF0157 family)